MAQITEKEMSAIGDLLTVETTLCAKCYALAEKTEDTALKDCYTGVAKRHQNRADTLFAQLK